jgi:hypothetical protein
MVAQCRFSITEISVPGSTTIKQQEVSTCRNNLLFWEGLSFTNYEDQGLSAYVPKTVYPLMGAGYNSFNARIPRDAIQNEATKELPYVHVDSYFQKVESFTHLASLLGLNASASLSTGFFSVGLDVRLMSQSSFTSTDLFCLFNVSVRTTRQILNGGQFTSGAADASRGTQVDFFKGFGDSFISEMEFGGDLFAMLSVHTETKERREELAESIQTGIGLFKAKAELYRMFEEMSYSKNVSLRMIQTGGQIQDVNIRDMDKTIDSFMANISEHPVATSLRADDYGLAAWPEDGQERFNFFGARQNVRALYAMAQTCQERLTDLQLAAENPEIYEPYKGLDEALSKVGEALNAVTENLSAYADNPIETKMISIDIGDVKPPHRLPKSLPDVWTAAGVTGISVVNGNSSTWTGIPGHTLDSIWLRPVGNNNIAFTEEGEFTVIRGTSVTTEHHSGGGDQKCGPNDGIGFYDRNPSDVRGARR